MSADSFRDLTLKALLQPGRQAADHFYVPLLSRAVSIPRAVGYFSSRELTLAAAGVSRFVANGGTMRLIAGAQLRRADVGRGPEGRAARRGRWPDGCWPIRCEGADIVARHHLETLAYLAREGRLEIRVGVPVSTTAGR